MILLHMASAVAVSFIIHLSMHEIGHLIGGCVTGWRFLHIQVFHFALVKSSNRIRFKYIPIFNNQCIMYPKSADMEAGIYTMGGCYMNLMLAIAGFVLLPYSMKNMVLWINFWCFFVTGIAFYLMNVIPKTKKICNDMACRVLLETDYITRVCHNCQLIIAKYLSEGYTYKKIDRDLIFLTEGMVANDILAYQAVLEYYYHLEAGDYEKMKTALRKVDTYALSREVLDIIRMEQLYADILECMRNKNALPSSYPDDINSYISKHEIKKDVHSIRINAAYRAYKNIMNSSMEKAGECIIKAMERLKAINCLYEGERIFCLKQLESILNLCQGGY